MPLRFWEYEHRLMQAAKAKTKRKDLLLRSRVKNDTSLRGLGNLELFGRG